MDTCKLCILHLSKGDIKLMIIKIFKISTAEMWTFYNKQALREYVIRNVLCAPSKYATVKELIQYLPIEDYCRIK